MFLVFLCFQTNAEMVLRFQVSTALSLCCPSELYSSKLNPCCKAHKTSKLYILLFIKKTKYADSPFGHFLSLFYRHSFRTTLLRRTSGHILETCKKLILFLPLSKRSAISLSTFPFLVLFCCSFFISVRFCVLHMLR